MSTDLKTRIFEKELKPNIESHVYTPFSIYIQDYVVWTAEFDIKKSLYYKAVNILNLVNICICKYSTNLFYIFSTSTDVYDVYF
jgi:hypothetical protein